MRRVELLDYARFLAALMVVAFHFLFKAIQEGKTPDLAFTPGLSELAKYGYLGVELFFMISGYVIFYSAKNKTAGEFAALRALRLYPAFWVAVFFTSLLSYLVPGDMFRVSGPQVLSNLTMVPGVLGYEIVDGAYWTLAYELKFYLLVGVILFLGLGRHLHVFFETWPIVMLIALANGWDHVVYLGGAYTFFAAGALFALLHEKLSIRRVAVLCLCLLLCLGVTLRDGARMSQDQGISYQPVILAAVIIVLFAFFAALQIPRVSSVKIPHSRLAGSLTYPLYLTHSVFGVILLSNFATQANAPLVYSAVVSLALLIAFVLHFVVERRMADHWHRLFDRLVRQPIDHARDSILRTLRSSWDKGRHAASKI